MEITALEARFETMVNLEVSTAAAEVDKVLLLDALEDEWEEGFGPLAGEVPLVEEVEDAAVSSISSVSVFNMRGGGEGNVVERA